jgi:hypothetical protein
MASSLYPKGAAHLLGQATQVDVDSDTLRYLYYAGSVVSTDEFVSDLTSGDIVARSDPLPGITVTDGVVRVTGLTYFSSVPDTPSPSSLILFKDTGADSTSPLILHGDVPAGVSPQMLSTVIPNPLGLFAIVPVKVVFDASGEWFCPPGNITQIYVECYGGGGAGADLIGSNSGGAGGGGGAYAARAAVPVTPGTRYTVTVGAGGSYPSDGGDTTFTGDSGVQVVAKGGKHGTGTTAGQGGQASGSTGDSGLVFSGGNGGTGGSTGTGGAGGGASGNRLGAGANGTSNFPSSPGQPGGAGANGGGSGGNGGNYTVVGNPGSAPGGAGGGGGGFADGGAGAHGRVTITIGT